MFVTSLTVFAMTPSAVYPKAQREGVSKDASVGVLQALVLRQHVTTWFWWALAVPPLWALGWVVTTAAGIAVDQHFANFGASGAIVVTALSGLLLALLLRAPRPVVAALTATGGA